MIAYYLSRIVLNTATASFVGVLGRDMQMTFVSVCLWSIIMTRSLNEQRIRIMDESLKINLEGNRTMVIFRFNCLLPYVRF